jgi:trigger factor
MALIFYVLPSSLTGSVLMKVAVENTSTLGRKLTVSIPSADLEPKVAERLKEVSRTVRLPGFRPGKVPAALVKNRFGPSIRAEVCEKELQPSYAKALEQENLRPAGMPEIEPVTMEEGKDFEYTAEFEVYPEFEVKGMDKLKIERASAEIGDADLEDMLSKLQQQHTEWTEVEREAKAGDRVKVDFEGKTRKSEDNDGSFPGNTANGAQFVIGNGTMPEEFEDSFTEALTGAKAGDEVKAKVKFPKGYRTEEVANKTATYTITVTAVEEGVTPEINDEFASKLGIEEGGAEKLREELKANMQRELDSAIKGKVKEQVVEGLTAANEVDVPNALITQEISRLREEAKQRASQYGQGNMDLPDDIFPDEMFAEQARQRVHVGLVFGEIIRANDLTADEAKVEEALDAMVAQYGEQGEAFKQYYRSNQQAMAGIESSVLEEQVVDLVLEKAKVSDKSSTFAEITGA